MYEATCMYCKQPSTTWVCEDCQKKKDVEKKRYEAYSKAVKNIFPDINEDTIRFIDKHCGLLPVGGSWIEMDRSELAELLEKAVKFGKELK